VPAALSRWTFKELEPAACFTGLSGFLTMNRDSDSSQDGLQRPQPSASDNRHGCHPSRRNPTYPRHHSENPMSTILKRPVAYREKPRRLTWKNLIRFSVVSADGLSAVTSEFGFSTELQALQSVAHSLGMSVVDLSKETVDPSILEGFPVRLMHRHGIFPIDRSSSSIRIVVSNPFDVQAADAVSAATGLFVMTILHCLTKSRLLIKAHLGVGAQTLDGLMAQAAENTDEIEILGDLNFEESEAAAMAQQASVVRLVNDILTEAVNNRASDIHMESQASGMKIRYRIDGVLQNQPVPPS
jgi:hypothetical protein